MGPPLLPMFTGCGAESELKYWIDVPGVSRFENPDCGMVIWAVENEDRSTERNIA